MPQVHCPEERLEAKEVGNYQYSSVPTEQSQICVKSTNLPSKSGIPVLAGRLLTKTPAPSTDDPVQEDLLQKYQERMERLSQQNRVIKICADAGFLTTIGVGQYFMTKDTEEFSQFKDSVACREYTLPRDEKSSDPKGWIRGNTKIGPVLEVTTLPAR